MTGQPLVMILHVLPPGAIRPGWPATKVRDWHASRGEPTLDERDWLEHEADRCMSHPGCYIIHVAGSARLALRAGRAAEPIHIPIGGGSL